MRSIRQALALRGLLTGVIILAFTSTAYAATPAVLLGTTDSFAALAGSTITNTGNSVLNGDLGLHPGTSVTGFPPGTVNGAQHLTDAVALQAKTDLTTAYKDAAGRSLTSTLPPDAGGRTFTDGVYRTGSVPSLGMTGTITLNAQGDPSAVFIFQIESTLTTATDSHVALINGAQACNVFWQVGSSATLGTRTAFEGTVLALTSISANEGATVTGRLLARNGALTLINNTITQTDCAAGTVPVGGGGGNGGEGGNGGGTTPGADVTGPNVHILAPPNVLGPPTSTDCQEKNFIARFRVADGAGILRVNIYLDGKLIRRTSHPRFAVTIKARGLTVGSHRIKVIARDRAGNRTVTRSRFSRCTLGLSLPRFTG